jgi:tetratricopeptide (TPR) repeat protein
MRFTCFRILLCLATLVLTAAPAVVFAAAGGGGGGGGGGAIHQGSSRSPEKLAEREYKRGLRKRDSAWKHERKANDTSSEKKRVKETSKAANDWNDAVKYYKAAIDEMPRHYQAHTSLGYALRKLGNYDASISAYGRALQLEPGFPEAIEYRAEAYLELSRLEDSSRAYMKLLRLDREKADLLMLAMDQWLVKFDDPAIETAPVKPALVDWFRGWVEERKQIEAKNAEPAAGSKGW